MLTTTINWMYPTVHDPTQPAPASAARESSHGEPARKHNLPRDNAAVVLVTGAIHPSLLYPPCPTAI